LFIFAFALGIADTGFVPDMADPDRSLAVMVSSIAAVFVLLSVTFIAGFAWDIEERRGGRERGCHEKNPVAGSASATGLYFARR
jgi:hypothetical protein